MTFEEWLGPAILRPPESIRAAVEGLCRRAWDAATAAAAAAERARIVGLLRAEAAALRAVFLHHAEGVDKVADLIEAEGGDP